MINKKCKKVGQVLKKVSNLIRVLVKSLGIFVVFLLTMILLNTVHANTFHANNNTQTNVNTKTRLNKSNEQPFSLKTFNALKHKNLGQQWAVILWSVDCPACFKELALVNKLRQEQPDLAIVFINADENAVDNEAFAERAKIIVDYGMGNLPNLYFSYNQATKSRYQIDPQWYGELPRSYFINRDGVFRGKSGLVQESLIRKWLMAKSQ